MEKAVRAKPIALGGYFDALSRRLRGGMGRAEALLWTELRGRRLLGYRFERKRQVDRYVVDFYSHELHMAVDVLGTDAPWHGQCFDAERTIRLRLCGVTFLPFGEEEVLYNLDGVVARIRQSIRHRPWR